MQNPHQCAAGQYGYERSAHLGTKQRIRACATGAHDREGRPGPEDTRKDMQREQRRDENIHSVYNT
jgi:hypothetical protein